MKGQARTTLFALCTVPFIMVLGNSMLIPVLPQIRNELNIGLAEVGLLITAFSLPAGIVIPFAGFMSDRIGRKTIIAPALILYGIGGLIAGLGALFVASPFTVILIGRVVQGIGAGGTYQLAIAMAADIFQSQERTKALGLLEASNGLGKVVSPITGGATALIVWFAPFFVYGLLALPAAALVWFVAKEPHPQKPPKNLTAYAKDIKEILAQKAVPLLASFLVGMVALMVLFGLLSTLSDQLEKVHHIPSFQRGLILAIPVLVMTITAYVSGTMLQSKIQKLLKPVILVGLALITAALFAYPFFRSPYILVGLGSVLGLGTGGLLPALNTLITSAAPIEERGLVTSFYGTVRFFGVAIGPPAFGLSESLGFIPVFLAASGVALATFFVSFLINPKVLLPEKMTKPGKQGKKQG